MISLQRVAAEQEQVVAALREENHHLREMNQALRDEVARLKGQKGKPNIGRSRLNHGEHLKREGHEREKDQEKPDPAPTRIVSIKATAVPAGSVFKGYADWTVQELVIQREIILYRLEKWLTPTGDMVTAELPGAVQGSHFGPRLRSLVLYQYHHAQVTEPLLLEQLREWDVSVSSGQLHRLITEDKEPFHQEKAEILRVGLKVSGHIHVDDTGARHQGKNGYCTHIGNDWFAWFESTSSKSRINFLSLLRAGKSDYVLSDEALEYMVAQAMPKQALKKLAALGEQTFADEHHWKRALYGCGIKKDRQVRIATEGALLGSCLSHGLNPKLAIISDDAGQFNVLCHLLCWIHAERILAKLVGFTDPQRTALEQVRTTVWELYRDLQAYKVAPTPESKQAIEKRFDELCATKTCFESLNLALQRMGKNKSELLRVLDRPELPLHNNLSEGDIREYVKRRKISGGTRSDEGRRVRDTFASLKKTCRKLGVSFWVYLNARIQDDSTIPQLPQLIELRAQPP